jgi:hypothetical protein
MSTAQLTLSLFASASLIGTAIAAPAAEGGRKFTTTMTGANEVPGPGDPDGTGTARVTINPGQSRICYELTVANIATANAAHIHSAPVGVAGPVVVPLAAPADGNSKGCVDVERGLADAIRKSPQGYYVNVHNAEFPAGAIRGQLG